jgi:hypothetical protein
MPASPLYKALKRKTGKRVIISDVKETLSPEAAAAGVIATDMSWITSWNEAATFFAGPPILGSVVIFPRLNCQGTACAPQPEETGCSHYEDPGLKPVPSSGHVPALSLSAVEQGTGVLLMARNDDDVHESTAEYRVVAERRERRRDRAHFEEMIRRWRWVTEQSTPVNP